MTEIIEASPSDAPRLSAFFRDAWKEAGPRALGWTGATEAAMEEIVSKDFVTDLLARPGTKAFAAVDAGEIIGVAVLRRIEPAIDELAGIILLESRTGHGVGHALLEAAVARSQADGAREVLVRTEASNARSLAFYRELGFTIEGQGPETVGGTRVDLVMLRRRLR